MNFRMMLAGLGAAALCGSAATAEATETADEQALTDLVQILRNGIIVLDNGPLEGAVQDCLNNPGTCAEWQEDTDRSGGAGGVLDITRLIDLFNGAGSFESWSFAIIGEACPSE